MKLILILLLSSIFGQAHAEEELSNDRIIFRTNYGDLVVALYPKVAPEHAKQILHLAEKGIFNQTSIFRIEKGFVAQIENHSDRAQPLTPKQMQEVVQMPAELSEIQHRRGHLSMAHYDEDINSGETSFSFLLGEAPHLDGQYTVFGEVVSGLDVLDLIENARVDQNNVPVQPIFIRSTKIVAAKDLKQVRLNGPLVPEVADDPYLLTFKILAVIAFSVTVSSPFIKTLAPLVLNRLRKRGDRLPA